MISPLHALIGATLLGLSAPALHAQEAPLSPVREPGQPLLTAPGGLIDASTGLMRTDEGWIGGGSDWEALFETSRVRFFPALPQAPEVAELTWTTSGVSRGDGPTIVLPAAEPSGSETGDERRVEYPRGLVTETYEMRLGGLKQSFVFHRLPIGSGDLVVRGTIDSVLPFAEQGPDGLRFANPAVGEVTIGKVTGFDASGESVEGSIVFDGRHTEFRLPGDWVDRARLPIVVDPLISTAQSVGNPTVFEEVDPAVAYDHSEDVYLVVWRRVFAANQSLIRAQRVNGNSSLRGGTIFLTSAAAVVIQQTPDVANVASTDAFGVVFAQSGNILCRRINTDGAVSNEVAIEDSSNFAQRPAVGGESFSDDEVMVVYDDQTLGIRARSVTIRNATDPTLVQVTTVVDNTNFPIAPSISKSGGRTGNHLIVWNEGTGNTRVRGRVYNRNLFALTPAVDIESTEDADNPQCDGNGSYWIVAWEAETTIASGDNDVEARPVYLSGDGTLRFLGPTQDVASDPNDDERGVDVAWLGNSVLVTWADEGIAGSGNYDLFVRQIDPITAQPLTFQALVAGGADDTDFVSICSTFSGNPDERFEEALLCWQQSSPTSEDALFRRWGNTVDGDVEQIGGSCGSAGNIVLGAPLIGNDCQITLTDASVNETAFLVFSFARISFGCGPCILIPDPFTGFTISQSTGSTGQVRQRLAIPNTPGIRGTTFFAQWLVTNTNSPGCTTFGTDLSRAVEVTIQ